MKPLSQIWNRLSRARVDALCDQAKVHPHCANLNWHEIAEKRQRKLETAHANNSVAD